MVSTILLTATLAQAAWDIKSPFATNTKTVWSMSVAVAMDGEEHEAKFKQVQEIAKFEVGKPFDAKISWRELEVDGNAMSQDPEFECTMDARGAVTATKSEMGDEVRRMLAPLSFVYPSSAVKAGDKWTHEVKFKDSSAETTSNWSFEVKGDEKIGDANTVMVASTFKESGKDGITADGTWWVATDGRLMKFEVKVKNWVVPMAGGDSFGATIKGEITK